MTQWVSGHAGELAIAIFFAAALTWMTWWFAREIRLQRKEEKNRAAERRLYTPIRGQCFLMIGHVMVEYVIDSVDLAAGKTYGHRVIKVPREDEILWFDIPKYGPVKVNVRHLDGFMETREYDIDSMDPEKLTAWDNVYSDKVLIRKS